MSSSFALRLHVRIFSLPSAKRSVICFKQCVCVHERKRERERGGGGAVVIFAANSVPRDSSLHFSASCRLNIEKVEDSCISYKK
jgi:hypothetical protein